MSRKRFYSILAAVLAIAAAVVTITVQYSVAPVPGSLLLSYGLTGKNQTALSMTSDCNNGTISVSYPNRNTGTTHSCNWIFTNHDPDSGHSVVLVIFGGSAVINSIVPNINVSTSMRGPTAFALGQSLLVASGSTRVVTIGIGMGPPPGQRDASVEFVVA